MWVVRELVRFVLIVAIASAVSLGLAELWLWAHGGDSLRVIRTACAVVGFAVMLLGAAPGITLDGRVGNTFGGRGWYMRPADPTKPRLNPTAAFIGCGAILIALAAFL
ncbi:MAG TPA: hypothetical protein VHV52_14320 [Gaiellaceae bacterium]|nr:hypothetical protein [Gaiellaceae bacterium]